MLFLLAVLLVPAPSALAAPAMFEDVTLYLMHGGVYQPACFDLRVEARSNGNLVAVAESFTTMPVCITSYSQIKYVRLNFVNDPLASVNPGDTIEVTVLARMAITRTAAVGSLRIWYGGPPAYDSQIDADLGATNQTYYFHGGGQLVPAEPPGPALSNVVYQIWKPSYYSLGTWSRVAP